MRITDWLRNMFGEKDVISIKQQAEHRGHQLAVEGFAIQAAINLIAGAIAKCEFKTYKSGKEIFGNDYYLWNIEPNKNQNSSQFVLEMVSRLLYDNECLVIMQNDQLVIAESFAHKEYALFPDEFSGVCCRGYSFDKVFFANDVIYLTYSNENIRALLSGLMQGYSNLLNMAVGKYKRAGGRKGVLDLNMIAQRDDDWNKKVAQSYTQQFKQYFNEENAIVTLPKGASYTEISGEGSKKSTSEVNDISNITQEAFARVAQAFRIPPALLQGDVADVDSLVDELLTFCIDPLCDLLETEINRKYYGKSRYMDGYRLKIDTTCIKHIDVFAVAEKVDKLISNGMYDIDEMRQKIGDVKLETAWSGVHWMTKNNARIEEMAKGGETSGD